MGYLICSLANSGKWSEPTVGPVFLFTVEMRRDRGDGISRQECLFHVLLNAWFENKHAIVGLGDFAHDIGEAGVALWGAELEGTDECREADGAD